MDNTALVLVEEAIDPEGDRSGVFESRLKEARDVVERAEEGLGLSEVKRYEAFLEVGRASGTAAPVDLDL